jgi:hypothetical protein
LQELAANRQQEHKCEVEPDDGLRVEMSARNESRVEPTERGTDDAEERASDLAKYAPIKVSRPLVDASHGRS